MEGDQVLKAHRRPGSPTTIVEVGGVRFGDGGFPVIAGPCSVESEAQVMETAHVVARGGAAMLRGGAFKPRTSPYSFQGLGADGLRLLRRAGDETGLPVVTEAMEPETVGLVADWADMIQIGSRNMQNFPLLKEAGRRGRPVLLKRGMSSTIDEWLLAAEYILEAGNGRVVLCERGIRTFETRTRNTLDISAVPVVRRLSHLPVVVDPSHAAGARDLIVPLARAGRAAGAHGMMVEVHPRPDQALSDGPQQLDAGGFRELMEALGIGTLREEIDLIDREIVRLLAERLRRALDIGREKTRRGLPVLAQDREEAVLDGVRRSARSHGLDERATAELFRLVIGQSRLAQAGFRDRAEAAG